MSSQVRQCHIKSSPFTIFLNKNLKNHWNKIIVNENFNSQIPQFDHTSSGMSIFTINYQHAGAKEGAISDTN
jgi:hypothetical protein